jgi:hypothetical protein
MTTESASAQKVDTSELNPSQLEQFWSLARSSAGMEAAIRYRLVCLTPSSASASQVKPIGSKPINEDLRDRLRKVLNTRTEKNPLRPQEAAELLGFAARSISAQMGNLFAAGEADRKNLADEGKRAQYSYWGLNKKIAVPALRSIRLDILSFLNDGQRFDAGAIAKALNLSRAAVYAQLKEMCEEGLVNQAEKCSGQPALFWIAETSHE